MMIMSIFVFKQKTAYEMRISDWSSDVCSSDLEEEPCREDPRSDSDALGAAQTEEPTSPVERREAERPGGVAHLSSPFDSSSGSGRWPDFGGAVCWSAALTARCARSEEHTSELQSLMRISYAVLCLKKT